MTYDEEMFTILMEECGEVIQECAKIMRFGLDSEYGGVSNRERLEKELGDVYCMIDLLHANDIISFTRLDDYANEKYEKLKVYSNLIFED